MGRPEQMSKEIVEDQMGLLQQDGSEQSHQQQQEQSLPLQEKESGKKLAAQVNLSAPPSRDPSRTRSITSFQGDSKEVATFTGPIRSVSPGLASENGDDEPDDRRAGRLAVPGSTVRLASRSPAPPAPKTFKGKLKASWVRNKGLFLMLLAQFFGTLMNVTTRLLEVEGNKGKGLHPFQILFARMFITFVLATAFMWYRRTPHFPFGLREVRLLLLARGFGGFFGVFGMYFSLLYLPLADATVITFLAPSLACWLCSILINEPFTRVEQIAGLVSLVGVTLIARPTSFLAIFQHHDAASSAHAAAMNTTAATAHPDASSYANVTPQNRLMAVGIGLIGVAGAACAYTTIRWIGKRAHPLISVNYFAAWCTIVSFVMQFALPNVGFLLPATPKEWAYLIFLGVCGFVMQFLLAAALAYEKSSRVTNMTYTQMLFALLFDKLVFHAVPSTLSIVGSSLILGSAMIVALQQDSSRAKDGNKDETNTANGNALPLREMRSREEDVGLMDSSRREGSLDAAFNIRSGEDSPLPIGEVQVRVLR